MNNWLTRWKARLHLSGTLHSSLSFKTENYNVSIPQPWGLMLNCYSHFLPHLDFPLTPSRHVNRTHMEKNETGFITLFFFCKFFLALLQPDNWTTLCRGQSTIYQVKTLKSETCTVAQDYCAGKLILHLMFFFFLFLFAKGPCKSCPLYLRPGVHCLTAGWEESMMGKTWSDLALLGKRETERKKKKRARVCEGRRRGCLRWMRERQKGVKYWNIVR